LGNKGNVETEPASPQQREKFGFGSSTAADVSFADIRTSLMSSSSSSSSSASFDLQGTTSKRVFRWTGFSAKKLTMDNSELFDFDPQE
jgi:hypothetical protein